jgi:transposase
MDHDDGQSGALCLDVLCGMLLRAEDVRLLLPGADAALLHRLAEALRTLARAFERVLKAGSRCADSKAATFCANVLELLPAVWRFVVTEGVEPTNYHAERLLRRGVRWRKKALGCQSAAGCRFVERMLTAVQTRRLPGRSALGYLYDAPVAPRRGRPAPSRLSAQ